MLYEPISFLIQWLPIILDYLSFTLRKWMTKRRRKIHDWERKKKKVHFYALAKKCHDSDCWLSQKSIRTDKAFEMQTNWVEAD